METVKVCLRASTGAVLLKGRRFLCVCARVCECVPGWGWVAVRRSRSTIAVFGGPHCRPCAVDYHTAVRMRSRQKQHDSPTLPDSTLPPPCARPPPQPKRREAWLFAGRTMGPDPGPAHSFCHPTRVRAIILSVVKKDGPRAVLPRFLLIFMHYWTTQKKQLWHNLMYGRKMV